ncbi:MAG TPA: HesA/MoeB/ThiF family protein [Anaerolineae bacterium]|nr:HesA/MoeB/ThiF family protein [Anaerolineae bacterium]
MTPLTPYDLSRYSRQMLIPGWGEEGQLKLKSATVFIAGAGGLGSPVALYLAVAGVGEIRVCDADTVELSNLNRQLLHSDARLGMPKAESAGMTLQACNPTVRIVPQQVLLSEQTIEQSVGQAQIVVDCLDNYETRYLLNTYCIQHRIPLVHGAIWGLTGQVTFLHPPDTPCLRCLTPEPPPKGTFPVVGVTPGLTGCLQAMEVLKFITGIGANLKGKLLTFDGEDLTFSSFRIQRMKACPACGHLV